MIKFCIKSFLLTRLFFFSLILICFNTFLGKYELSHELLDSNKKDSLIELTLVKFLKYFYSYDAIHFSHIAKNDYTTDLNFAFFPLFPTLIKYGYHILNFIFENIRFKLVHIDTLWLLSGFLISNLLCLFNTICLSKLSMYITNDVKKSKLITLLFLINPGSIFFMSTYSENLYLSLQLLFILMLLVNKQENNFTSVVLFIIIMSSSRSTAIFLSCYLLIPLIVNVTFLDNSKYDSFSFKNNLIKFLKAIKEKISNVIVILIYVLVFLIVFFWNTRIKPSSQICSSVKPNLKINSDFSPYYNNILNEYQEICFKTGMENIYSHIQNKYWDVSLFSQYKFEKIDRIILSTPMNILGIFLICYYMKYFNFKQLLSLRFDKFLNTSDSDSLNQRINKRTLLYNAFLLSSFANFIINFLIVVLIAHPQINNRVYTTCPIIYFYCADEILKFSQSKSLKGLFILCFFIIYSILGCLMQVGSYGFA